MFENADYDHYITSSKAPCLAQQYTDCSLEHTFIQHFALFKAQNFMVFDPLSIRIMLISVYVIVLLQSWSTYNDINWKHSSVYWNVRYHIFCKIYTDKHMSAIWETGTEMLSMSCIHLSTVVCNSELSVTATHT